MTVSPQPGSGKYCVIAVSRGLRYDDATIAYISEAEHAGLATTLESKTC
jgi:hypothetical protein